MYTNAHIDFFLMVSIFGFLLKLISCWTFSKFANNFVPGSK